ncbi:malonate decarboxylase holo-ACP synthase [Massilia forsythiae]|uniref:Malonate decarboxylase holo-ACP synthase n=2 Tax=Massilia forsythiae TaxID=2728020 RepID=A0A7Z2W2Z3_9BURK|nr:malonate decarboxylase holo-ACP synthase [Massilia forsythiae]
MAAPRPHDLLWLARAGGFTAAASCRAGWSVRGAVGGTAGETAAGDPAAGAPDNGAADAGAAAGAGAASDLPSWLDTRWLMRTPLVVRRAPAPPGRVAAGARGLQRSQRCAGLADLGALARRVTPEQLAAGLRGPGDGRPRQAAEGLPCIAALLLLAPRLDALGLAWGPAGGAGFWLATGLPVLRSGSDLDLLVRAPAAPPAATLAALAKLADAAPCRLDIQVDTGHGGFALAELVRGAGRVLLKTARGPLLLADPWAWADDGGAMDAA